MKETKNTKPTSNAPAVQEENKRVAVVNEIQSENVLAHIGNIAADGAEDERFESEDLNRPFVRIIQTNSKEVARGSDKFIREAQVGNLYNIGTRRLYNGDDGIIFIPVHYMRSYMVWAPRPPKGPGGIVHDYGSDSSLMKVCKRDDDKKLRTPDGNFMVVSGVYLGLIVDEEDKTVEEVIMPLSGAQLKKSKTWNTYMNGLRIVDENGMKYMPPKFYMSYRITTVPESGNGFDWFGYKIDPHINTIDLFEKSGAYLIARKFSHKVKEGSVKVDMSKSGTDDDQDNQAIDVDTVL